MFHRPGQERAPVASPGPVGPLRALILSLVVGAGASIGALHALPGPAPGRVTIPLGGETEQVVFLGIEGDYRAMEPDKMAELLTTAHELELIGTSLRSETEGDRRVWAVKTNSSAIKLAKTLKRSLDKIEFEVYPVHVTVLSPLASVDLRDVRSAVRLSERAEEKITAIHFDSGTRQMWVFHDPKLKSKKVEKVFRDLEMLIDFHHQEFDLVAGGEAKASANLDALNGCAGEKLDLVRSTRREDALVLDVYLRDMESFQVLELNKRDYFCPAFAATLLADAPAGVEWSVTLSNDGFPFVGR